MKRASHLERLYSFISLSNRKVSAGAISRVQSSLVSAAVAGLSLNDGVLQAYMGGS